MGSLDSSNKMEIDMEIYGSPNKMEIDMEIYESPGPLENQEKISGDKPDSRIKMNIHLVFAHFLRLHIPVAIKMQKRRKKGNIVIVFDYTLIKRYSTN